MPGWIEGTHNHVKGSNSHEVFGGSGLGLFVSRKLCDLMSGAIGVDSVFGQGATFRFYIKVKTSATPKTPSSGSSPTRTPPKLSADPMGPTSQMAFHILITEDNVINQTVRCAEPSWLRSKLIRASLGSQSATEASWFHDRVGFEWTPGHRPHQEASIRQREH